MLDYLLLGLLQGICEWLPVSSKTVLFLASSFLLGRGFAESYDLALALQAGTIASAVLYFRSSWVNALRDKRILTSLALATLLTGAVGVPLYLFARGALESAVNPAIPTLSIAVLLAVQALVGRSSKAGVRHVEDVKALDSVLLGIVQGVASLPGVSRSGSTITLLLYLGFAPYDALNLSFMASVPASAGALATVLLLSGGVLFENPAKLLAAFAVAAVTGYFCIKALMKLARGRGPVLTGLMAATALLAALLSAVG